MQGLTPYLQWRLWPLGTLAVLFAIWAAVRRQAVPEQRRLFS